MSEALDSLHPMLRDLPGQTLVGRYKVDEALGVGGMGAVFRGHHIGIKRDVAIKVLNPDLSRDPEISKRFDREAHSASRLDHPNCLRVTDNGTTGDGIKFMVMDLLSGVELADRMGEPIEPERAVLMTLQVLKGLEHAHEHGVIHRDVKPENVFVTRDHDGREVLKLVDFGIAKLSGGSTKDTHMTKAGLIFGTPAYMSPEQAMGMEADARADLYSVGVILYEMLAGSPPFESDDPVKLVRMQVSKDPPPLPDDVAPPLAEVVMTLLAKDRDERYQSATQAREALEMVLPAVASSDVISGVTILGSTTSGPILLSHGTSIPIAVSRSSSSLSVAAGYSTGPLPAPGALSGYGTGPLPPPGTLEPSGSFAPSALPTLPPGHGAMRRPRSKLPLIGGAAIIVLGLLAWLSSGDDAEGVGTGDGGPAATSKAGDDSDPRAMPADDEGSMLVIEDGPDEDQLAEIDRLVFSDKLDDAQTMLKPLLDEYSQSATLLWRQGRIYDKRRNTKDNKRKALIAYGEALDKNRDLLTDQDFYAELDTLLKDSKLRNEALDFALRKMGRHGHKFLLELINDDKPLPYPDRTRALQELSKVEENGPLVDWRRHRALDLWQAGDAPNPCATYRRALDEISEWDDYKYLPDVEGTKPPKAKTGDDLTEADRADAAKCEGLEARRAEVVAQLQALAPEDATGGELVLEDEPEAPKGDGGGGTGGSSDSKSGGSKSGGSKSGGSKSGGSKSGGGKKPCKFLDKAMGKCK